MELRRFGPLRRLYPGAALPAAANFARSRVYPSARDSETQLSREQAGLFTDQSIQAPELSDELALPPPFTQAPAAPVRDELKYGRALLIPFSQGVPSARILVAPPPNTRRAFLFIVNTHAIQILFVNFGDVASALNGIPVNPGNGAIGFDAFVPQDDIYLAANGAATTGVLVYSNKGVNDYPALAGG